jgi:hypothetical protein
MQRPSKWGEEQKYEVIRSSIGNALINLRLLTSSGLALELGLLTQEERETLLKAASIVQDVYRRAKERGVIR